jgi:glycosyltransferase involved in cell wall biosynthesis
MMRVLLITDWLRLRGGMETYFTTLRAGLQSAGHETRLLTSTAGTAADGTADYRAYGAHATAAQSLLQIANPFAVARVRSAVHEFRPDLAVVGMLEQHLSPAIIAALRRVPTILSVGDYKPICPVSTKLLRDGSICTVPAGSVCWRGGCVGLAHWLRDRPRYALLHAGLARVGRLLACSVWLRRALAAHGIETEALPLPTPPPGAGFVRSPAGHPLFVYVGRLSREKGVAGLLRAFATTRASFPGAELRLVGDGEERPTLERLASSLGLGGSVTFRGWLPAPGIDAELAPAWASTAPSLYAEPLGLVAVEAIVRGVPVVASRDGGLAETVEHGLTGLLFPNGDEEALAACLMRIAARDAFPDHTLPARPVLDMADRHSPARHVARIEEIREEITQAAHARAVAK